MDKSRYPADWDEISRRIRFERAGNKCEWCRAPNGELIYRDPDDRSKWTVVPDPISEADVQRIFGGKPIRELSKVIRVVLTVAHIHNPDPMDCRDENLACLCQRCHNKYDAPMRALHAKNTRQRRLTQLKLWDDQNEHEGKPTNAHK